MNFRSEECEYPRQTDCGWNTETLYQNCLGEMSVSLTQCIKTSGPDEDLRGHEVIKAGERKLKNFLHLIFVGCFTCVSASYFYIFLLLKRREKKQPQEEKKITPWLTSSVLTSTLKENYIPRFFRLKARGKKIRLHRAPSRVREAFVWNSFKHAIVPAKTCKHTLMCKRRVSPSRP